MNLAIKSGTNQFHGSGFYYNRNEFFAANTPFAPPKPEVVSTDINSGFSFGGPIVKGKTFFFSSYEYQGFGIANTISATEPSAAYQAAAQSVLSFYGVPTNVVSTALLSTLWPADALTGPQHVAITLIPQLHADLVTMASSSWTRTLTLKIICQ